jgi:hypothetical protein
MGNSKKSNSEAGAIGVIDEALSGLSSDDERVRVLEWACKKYGVTYAAQRSEPSRSAHVGAIAAESESLGYGSKAVAYMKRSRLTDEEIRSAFHLDGASGSVIVPTVPGPTGGKKLRQVAGLFGLLKLLTTDDAKFTSDEFREVLRQYDAYDQPNFSTYLKKNKDVVLGNSKSGFSVTSVGLDLAVAVLRGEAAT